MIKTTTKGQWFYLTVPLQWDNQTIEDVFRSIWKSPKKLTHQMRMNREVTLNHKYCEWTTPLHKGDQLGLHLFKKEHFGVTPTFLPIDIVYEDEHLLVVNKPAGMKTHPNTSSEHDTLANAVAFHMLSNGEDRHVQHIHRLDQDTSGLVLFSKHKFIGSILDRMLKEREIKRTYTALTYGRFSRKIGTITAPIGRDRHHATRRRISENGQQAITHYKVLEQKPDLAKIECQLDTGRTHQIRVHLSSMGHPILGDSLYGNYNSYPRLALHAEALEFTHPFSLEHIEVMAKADW